MLKDQAMGGAPTPPNMVGEGPEVPSQNLLLMPGLPQMGNFQNQGSSFLRKDSALPKCFPQYLFMPWTPPFG